MHLSFRNITHRFVIDSIQIGGPGFWDLIVSNPQISGLHIYVKYERVDDNLPIVPACYYDVTFDDGGHVARMEYVAHHRYEGTIRISSK